MVVRLRPTDGRWIVGFAIGASRDEGDIRGVLYIGPVKLQVLGRDLDDLAPPTDRLIHCPACGFVPHRWRPNPESGPFWRCSECGEANTGRNTGRSTETLDDEKGGS